MRSSSVRTLLLVLLLGVAACGDDPLRAGRGGAGGSGAGGSGTGGSGPTAPSCDTLSPTLSPAVITLPNVLDLGAFRGSFRLTLTSPTADGWKATPDPAIPLGAEVDVDGGHLLDGFALHDRLRVDVDSECQPFSGCWQWMVVKRDTDGKVLSAWFRSFASQLGAFGDAVGLAFNRGSVVCIADNVCGPSTQTTLVVDGQPIMPTAQSTVSLAGSNYLVHVAAAFAPGPGADVSSCTDAGPFQATRVDLEVVLISGS